MRYIDPTLAAYVGESVVLRYDPRDLAEVRLFHQGQVPLPRDLPGACRARLCRCATFNGRAINGAAISARHLRDRRETVETLLDLRRGSPPPMAEPIAPGEDEPDAGSRAQAIPE